MQEGSISLYFDLIKGNRIDLEVSAKAALAFSQLVKTIAYSIEPQSEIQIDLVSGTEGSFDFNMVVRILRQGTPPARKEIVALLAGVALTLLIDARAWSVGKVLDWLTGADAPEAARQLSREELQGLSADIVMRLRQGVGEAERDRLLSTIIADPVITGVGTSAVPSQRPLEITARPEFITAIAPPPLQLESQAVAVVERREYKRDMTITLISPVLSQSRAQWRFRAQGVDFNAAVRDRIFANRMLSGEFAVRLKAGIELDVTMHFFEVKDGPVWNVAKRQVEYVHRIRDAAGNLEINLTTSETK